mgnify:CR=1 FL=1
MDPKAAAAHLQHLEAQLGKQNVAAMMVYTQLLKRMQMTPPLVYFTTVAPEVY